MSYLSPSPFPCSPAPQTGTPGDSSTTAFLPFLPFCLCLLPALPACMHMLTCLPCLAACLPCCTAAAATPDISPSVPLSLSLPLPPKQFSFLCLFMGSALCGWLVTFSPLPSPSGSLVAFFFLGELLFAFCRVAWRGLHMAWLISVLLGRDSGISLAGSTLTFPPGISGWQAPILFHLYNSPSWAFNPSIPLLYLL